MRVPADAPTTCPVCEHAYESVSLHETGLMINLIEYVRFQRVCFEPVLESNTSMIRFYHHTHTQASGDTHASDVTGPTTVQTR